MQLFKNLTKHTSVNKMKKEEMRRTGVGRMAGWEAPSTKSAIRNTHHILPWCGIIYAIAICIAISATAETKVGGMAILLETGKYREAAQLLEELASSTKDVEQLGGIYDQLGEIYYTYVHDYPKALKVYDEIIRVSAKGLTADDRFLGYIKKGDVYCRIGKYGEAIQTYQILIDQSPPVHFAHKTGSRKIRSIQTALDDLRNQERAIQAYKGSPRAIEAKFHIAELYRSHHQLNQPQKAIEVYEEILKRHGDTKLAPEAQWRIGNLQDKVLNQPKRAIEAYQKLADNYPTSNFTAEALFQIGRIHEMQKRYALAGQIFEKLQQNYPDFWNMHAVFYWSGVCYEKLRDYRRATDALKTFLYIYLVDLDPIYFGAIGKYNQSPLQVEKELKERIQQLQSDLPQVEWERVTKLIAQENYIEALPIARQLVVGIPDSEYTLRVRAQLRSIELHAAIQKLRKQDAEIHPYAQFRVAQIYERELKDYTQAVAEYRQLIETQPQSPWAAEALYRSGIIHAEQLSHTEKAIELYQSLIKKYPPSSQTMMAHFQLGEIYRVLHRYDDALKAYQTTIAYPKQDQYLADGYKDSFADQAQFRIGRVHYEDQRYNDALAAFQEFIESQSYSPRLAAAYIYLAHISQERGNNRSAWDAYSKARSLISNSPIQAEMVIYEAQDLGFQGIDSKAVIQRLDELRKRVSNE